MIVATKKSKQQEAEGCFQVELLAHLSWINEGAGTNRQLGKEVQCRWKDDGNDLSTDGEIKLITVAGDDEETHFVGIIIFVIIIIIIIIIINVLGSSVVVINNSRNNIVIVFDMLEIIHQIDDDTISILLFIIIIVVACNRCDVITIIVRRQGDCWNVSSSIGVLFVSDDTRIS